MRPIGSRKKHQCLLAVVFAGLLSHARTGKAPAATVPARMTVTLRVLGDDKRMPEVNREDVIVRQGKDRLQVTGLDAGSRRPLRTRPVHLDR